MISWRHLAGDRACCCSTRSAPHELRCRSARSRSIWEVARYKQVYCIGARPGGRCDTRLSRIITDKYHKNEAFPLVKCIRRMCGMDR